MLELQVLLELLARDPEEKKSRVVSEFAELGFRKSAHSERRAACAAVTKASSASFIALKAPPCLRAGALGRERTSVSSVKAWI